MTATSAARPFALVTGASSGIGRELAGQFAEHGYDLLVAAEDEGIEAAAAQLRSSGTEVTAARVDLSTADGVEALWSRVDRPVDAAAINAGIGLGGRFVETDLDTELRMVGTNVAGTVHLAKRVLTAMTGRGSGRVLFTSSIASTMPGPYEAVYAASKSFVQSFAEALHEEVDGTGVTVTSLMPGPTATNFFARAGMEQDTKMGQGPKDDAADVARKGFEGLMAGRQQVVPSGKSKLAAAADAVLPDRLKAKLHSSQAEPGSGD